MLLAELAELVLLWLEADEAELADDVELELDDWLDAELVDEADD